MSSPTRSIRLCIHTFIVKCFRVGSLFIKLLKVLHLVKCLPLELSSSIVLSAAGIILGVPVCTVKLVVS